jgi:hypothetical protein
MAQIGDIAFRPTKTENISLGDLKQLSVIVCFSILVWNNYQTK